MSTTAPLKWLNLSDNFSGGGQLPAKPSADKVPPRFEPLEHELLRQSEGSLVFAGYDTRDRRHVVIKKILNDRLARTTKAYMAVAAALDHPCLVRVLNFDQRSYEIVMERMATSLSANVDATPLDAHRARSILVDALEGLAYIHRHDCIHGGIKPGNLLLDESGKARLGDARCYPLGGPWLPPSPDDIYMPPELANPDLGSPGPASDLYCLATSLIHALTADGFYRIPKGRRRGPSNASSERSAWHADPALPYPPVQELVRGIDSPTARVLDRMARKPIHERYTSAADALADLYSGSSNRSNGRALSNEPNQNALVSPLTQLCKGQGNAAKQVTIVAAPGAHVKGFQAHATPSLLSRFTRLLATQRQEWIKQRISIVAAATILIAILTGVLLWPAPLTHIVRVKVLTRPNARVTTTLASPGSDAEKREERADGKGRAEFELTKGRKYQFMARDDGNQQSEAVVKVVELNMDPVKLPITAPIPPREVAPTQHDLQLSISPETAEVCLDGKSQTYQCHREQDRLVGKIRVFPTTDVNSIKNKERLCKLEVTEEGYEPFVREFAASELNGKPLVVDLKQIRQVVVQLSEPARLYCQGIEVSSEDDGHLFRFGWPENAPQITIWVNQKGFQPTEVTLKQDEIHSWPHLVSIPIHLVELPHEPRFLLDGVPPNSEIFVDGKSVGSNPELRTAEGNYEIVVKAHGYRTWKRRVSIVDGGRQQIDLVPFRNSGPYLRPKW